MMITESFKKKIKQLNYILLVPGVISVCAFAYFYIIEASGHCGVVRFYEYIIGIFGIGIWTAGLISGFLFIKKGSKRASLFIIGSTLTAIVNLAMLATISYVIYVNAEADFVFTDTDQLVELVSKNNDVLAALKLGERNIVSAAPLLCKIADDTTKDINLRHNAVKSLGMIGSSSQTGTDKYEQIFTCLLKVLGSSSDAEKYLRKQVAGALGQIGDKRATLPLFNCLDREIDEYAKAGIVDAIGIIGDERAIPLLQNFSKTLKNDRYLSYRVKKALEKLAEIGKKV